LSKGQNCKQVPSSTRQKGKASHSEKALFQNEDGTAIFAAGKNANKSHHPPGRTGKYRFPESVVSKLGRDSYFCLWQKCKQVLSSTRQNGK